MPLLMNHTAGGGIFDVNNLHCGKPSADILKIGKEFGRLDTAMNFSDTGRRKKEAVRICPPCPQCFMIMPLGSSKPLDNGGILWTCPDCECEI